MITRPLGTMQCVDEESVGGTTQFHFISFTIFFMHSGLGVVVDGYTPSPMNGRSQLPTTGNKDRSFMILPSDKVLPQPKQYFKSVSNAAKGIKQTRAKIVNPSKRKFS